MFLLVFSCFFRRRKQIASSRAVVNYFEGENHFLRDNLAVSDILCIFAFKYCVNDN